MSGSIVMQLDLRAREGVACADRARAARQVAHEDRSAAARRPRLHVPVGPDAVVGRHRQVLELELHKRIHYAWRGGGIDTVVTWMLQPTASGGTLLALEHSGFRPEDAGQRRRRARLAPHDRHPARAVRRRVIPDLRTRPV